MKPTSALMPTSFAVMKWRGVSMFGYLEMTISSFPANCRKFFGALKLEGTT
jgi:hypothetical protein